MSANLRLIRQVLETARASRIRIARGACFSWIHGQVTPEAVNWAGAVLWMNRDKIVPDYSTSRLLKLCGGDLFWFYRFSLGFDQGRVLAITDPETEREIRKDEVSLDGLRMAREFAPWPVAETNTRSTP